MAAAANRLAPPPDLGRLPSPALPYPVTNEQVFLSAIVRALQEQRLILDDIRDGLQPKVGRR